ncbi:hypothetical protein ACIHAA_27460 [Streptomyces sp. NPDC052040]|uniref:hypothetical protein n=1 Tax=unclassified Streptomyces TaxID=2593676 RepID=UPI0037CE6F95
MLHHLRLEKFTNGLEYARGATVQACLSFEPDQIILEVRSGPSAGARLLRNSRGMGLAGLRLRISVSGGHLTAGHLRDGGFRVEAVLPAPASCGPKAPHGAVPETSTPYRHDSTRTVEVTELAPKARNTKAPYVHSRTGR